MKAGLLLTLIAWTISASASTGWDVSATVSCPSLTTKSQAAWTERVRTAEPTDPYYVPNPFPESKDEVIENFVSSQESIWADTGFEDLPKEEQRLFRLLRSEQLRFELLTVRLWGSGRCHMSGYEVPFIHLLRGYDTRSKVELLRASLSEDGNLREVHFIDDKHRPRVSLSSLSEVTQLMRARATIQPATAQWVHTSGTLPCRETVPCVAFRSTTGETYLASPTGFGGQLVRLRLDERTSVGTGAEAMQHNMERAHSLVQQGRHLVTIDGDFLVVADPVP